MSSTVIVPPADVPWGAAPPEAAGNPAAIGRDLPTAEVQAAIAAVRRAPAEARYGKLIELLRVLHPEGTS